MCPVPGGDVGFTVRDVAVLYLSLTVLMAAVRWEFGGDGRKTQFLLELAAPPPSS